MKTSFHFLCLLLILLANAITGMKTAQASYGIMPMEAQVQIPQNNISVTNDIEVYNGSDAPLYIKGSIISWKLTPQGDYEYSSDVNEPQSCASWIRLNPEQFVVPAQKSVRVRYTVTPPAAFTQEHRAMIFFESRPIPQKEGNISLNVVMRMGCKVFVQPAQAGIKRARISDMKFENTEKPQLQVDVENLGPLTCRAGGKVQIFNAKGELVNSAQLQPQTVQVLPGFTRLLTTTLPEPLPVGEYHLKAIVDYGGKQLLGGELTTKVLAP